jgi:uncharacterized protein involved in type VI secretion and phage assembly
MSILDEMQGELGGDHGRFFGVTVGIVTDNHDPEKLGRVRVRFPWLSETDASHWARVAAPMAGKGRGVFMLPEVEDEVLVAFEHGRPESAYILGGLWNGKDAPPADNADGKNNLRVIRSRAGHEIVLDDTDGAEKVIVRDGGGKDSVTIDMKAGTVTVKADKKLVLDCAGELTIGGDGAKVTITGAEVKLDCDAFKVNGNALEVAK